MVALISATPAAIHPAEAAFRRTFPSAVLWNLLDDRLLAEADERGGLDAELHDRMGRLIDHAIAGGAAGVLMTCSMYAPVAHAYSTGPTPVLAPDDAAFERIAELGPPRVLVVGSLPNPLQDSCNRLRATLESRGASVEVTGVVAEGAFEAAVAGDTERIVESIQTAIEAHGGTDDAPVFLAQYSLAPAAGAVADRLCVEVITGPDSAAVLLRARLTGMEGES
jgi:hypothetical protein